MAQITESRVLLATSTARRSPAPFVATGRSKRVRNATSALITASPTAGALRTARFALSVGTGRLKKGKSVSGCTPS